jgi:hypothetical protein
MPRYEIKTKYNVVDTDAMFQEIENIIEVDTVKDVNEKLLIAFKKDKVVYHPGRPADLDNWNWKGKGHYQLQNGVYKKVLGILPKSIAYNLRVTTLERTITVTRL